MKDEWSSGAKEDRGFGIYSPDGEDSWGHTLVINNLEEKDDQSGGELTLTRELSTVAMPSFVSTSSWVEGLLFYNWNCKLPQESLHIFAPKLDAMQE